MNFVREKSEYYLTKGFFSLLKFCPMRAIYAICRGFALVFFFLATKRRNIALKNLGIAFPEKSATERRRIAKAAYIHFGEMIAESAMIMAGKISFADLDEMVDGTETKVLFEEEEGCTGLLGITGHLGSFEMFSHYMGSHTDKGRRVHVVARRGNNKLIDEKIVKPMRESFGSLVIYKDRALPHIVRALKTNDMVGLLIDIKSNSRQGVSVDFFGKQTLSLKTSAYLQIKLNPRVVPTALVRTAHRRYKIITGQPIKWHDNGKPLDEQIVELTQIHHSALEDLIRKYPEQWFWMHNRWKN